MLVTMDTLKIILAAYLCFGLMASGLAHNQICKDIKDRSFLRPILIFVSHSIVSVGWLYLLIELVVNHYQWKIKMKRRAAGGKE